MIYVYLLVDFLKLQDEPFVNPDKLFWEPGLWVEKDNIHKKENVMEKLGVLTIVFLNPNEFIFLILRVGIMPDYSIFSKC